MNATADDLETNLSNNNTYPNGLRAFTFWIFETLYAVDIGKVLTISQDLSNIQNMPSQGKGLLGMTEFQGYAIPVIDFAAMLNLKSGTQAGQELIKIFNNREQDHHEWINALENSIMNGDAFLKAKDPNQCAFGVWKNNFITRDETLDEIMHGFDTPHERIHGLADKLLNMRLEGKQEEALKILNMERDLTMKRLTKHFNHAREHIRDSSRAVLLYITEDGITPTIALQIDEINDVIDFKVEQFKPMETLKSVLSADEHKLISHYIKLDNTADCLLVNASNISELIKRTE